MNDKEKYVLEHYEITKDGKVFSTYTNKYLKYRKDKERAQRRDKEEKEYDDKKRIFRSSNR